MALDQFTRSLPMMLYRTLDAVMPRFRKIFNDFGLTEQQGRVLRVLWEQDEVGLGELAKLTALPSPSLVGIVDRLAAMGLVARARSTRDRRVVNVSVTAQGKALEPEIMPRVAAAYAALKQTVDPAAWDRALQGLEQISRAGETRQGGA